MTDGVRLAFIQLKMGTRLPLNETCYVLWYGCEALGIQTEFFEFIQDIRTQITPETLVCGGVSNVKQALRLLNAEPPIMDAPEELLPYFGRRTWATTMSEVRKRLEDGTERIFIKPLEHQKAFTGHVVDGSVSTLIQTAGFDDDFKLLASEVVDFVSEYRVMVHRGEMIVSRHYLGDFTVTPDYQLARQMIKAFKSAPVGYSLDLGVTTDGRTLVVEVNDCWALGAYGAPYIPYVRMVTDRWEEMCGQILEPIGCGAWQHDGHNPNCCVCQEAKRLRSGWKASEGQASGPPSGTGAPG